MSELLSPVPPGEVLMEEFIVPAGLSAYQLGEKIGISPHIIAEILACKRPISSDVAALLDAYFKMSPGFFSRLQNDYQAATLA